MKNEKSWRAVTGVVLTRRGLFALLAERPLRKRYLQTLTGKEAK